MDTKLHKITIDGYKPIYVCYVVYDYDECDAHGYDYDDNEGIFAVNSRDDFKIGLKDYVVPERTMTKRQVDEVRAVEITDKAQFSKTSHADQVKILTKMLSNNCFKLIPE